MKIIAGPFGGDTGYVVAVHEDTITIAIIQENGTSDNVSYYESLCSLLTNWIGRSIEVPHTELLARTCVVLQY